VGAGGDWPAFGVVLPLYRYMTRRRIHTEVAEVLDRTVRKSGE